MGCLYFRPAGCEAEDMELYFAAYYLCRLLAGREITLQTACEIQKACGEIGKIREAAETGKVRIENVDVAIVPYHANWTCGLSASMLLGRNEKFRLGQIGFGWVFKNKKKLALCSRLSVYALYDTLMKVRKQDEILKNRLDGLYERIAVLKLGKDLYLGNVASCAQKLYNGIIATENGKKM